MIYFLHGDHQIASREKLNQLLAAARVDKKEVIQLDGVKINQNQLLQALESSSLFGQDKLIIVEGLFSRSPSREKDAMVKYLKKEAIEPDLIFWEKKSIPGTTTRWLPKNWQFEEFKTPVAIFKFLDSFKPKSEKILLTLLRDCIKKDSAEMVFYMLARRLHDLIIAKDLGKSGLRGAPWQIGKLLHQAGNFTLEQLTQLYQKLLQIDTDIKTGQTLMPLDWQLDLLIVNL